MILIEREITLPSAVEVVKTEVLLCLRTVHDLHEYDAADELKAHLEGCLAAAGMTGLTRVVLFYRDPRARFHVEQLMLPDGTLTSFHQPECWNQLKKSLPELRRRAERFEPGWVAEQMRTQQ